MTSQKKLLISRKAIANRVKELAAQISRDYVDKNPLLVAILKGAFIFLADLARAVDYPVQVDFVRLRSYGAGTTTSGEVHITKDVELPIKGRHVLVVEDIVDAGLTLDFLLGHLASHQPASLKICCLIDKKERRQVEVPLDYVGFTVEKGFLVGYGLDSGENLRTLPDIYEIV
ncbi:MAG: hypoxanthine phosphoribosyltransferase [Desulfobaccales bacterium]